MDENTSIEPRTLDMLDALAVNIQAIALGPTMPHPQADHIVRLVERIMDHLRTIRYDTSAASTDESPKSPCITIEISRAAFQGHEFRASFEGRNSYGLTPRAALVELANGAGTELAAAGKHLERTYTLASGQVVTGGQMVEMLNDRRLCEDPLQRKMQEEVNVLRPAPLAPKRPHDEYRANPVLRDNED